MKFTEAEIEEYASGKKPFPPALLEIFDYNRHNFGEYLLKTSDKISEENLVLSRFFRVAFKKQVELIIPKITALYGECPTGLTEIKNVDPLPAPIRCMGHWLVAHSLNISKMNNLSGVLFVSNMLSLLVDDTSPEISGFFNTINWRLVETAVIKFVISNGCVTNTDEKLRSSSLTGKMEESKLIELITKWLEIIPLDKFRLPAMFKEGRMRFYLKSEFQHSLSKCILDSAKSESSLFILDREVVKNFLIEYDLTELIWELLNEDAQQIRPIYKTCSSLAFSDTQTKEYMRQSLVKIYMDMTVDLSEITL